jgi:hypothetical protein
LLRSCDWFNGLNGHPTNRSSLNQALDEPWPDACRYDFSHVRFHLCSILVLSLVQVAHNTRALVLRLVQPNPYADKPQIFVAFLL